MRNLAADIVYLGDVGKEGVSLLLNMTHPISKAGDRLRMKLTSKLFANPNIMRKFARRSAGTQARRSCGKNNECACADGWHKCSVAAIRQAGVRAIGVNPQLQVPALLEVEDVLSCHTITASGIDLWT